MDHLASSDLQNYSYIATGLCSFVFTISIRAFWYFCMDSLVYFWKERMSSYLEEEQEDGKNEKFGNGIKRLSIMLDGDRKQNKTVMYWSSQVGNILFF